MSGDRLPPHNQEAEEAVLGSMIIDPDEAIQVSTKLRPEDFFLSPNRALCEGIFQLVKENEPVDFVTLTNALEETGKLDSAGGYARILSLTNAVPTTVNAMVYAEIVLGLSVRRQLIQSAGQMATKAHDLETPVSDVLSFSETELLRLRRNDTSSDRLCTSEEASDQFWDYYLSAETFIIPTGFPAVDKILNGGLRREHFTVVAAAPKMGKTAFMRCVLLNAAKNGLGVLLISGEMKTRVIYSVNLSSLGGVPHNEIENKRITKDHPMYDRLKYADQRLRAFKFAIDDTRNPTPSQMMAAINRYMFKYGQYPDVIGFDYLTKFAPEKGKKYGNRTGELEHISDSIATICSEIGCAGILGSQIVEKEVGKRKDRRPEAHDILGSGAAYRDCGSILTVYREDQDKGDMSEKPNIAEIICRAGRFGGDGTAELYFDKPHVRMTSLEKKEYVL